MLIDFGDFDCWYQNGELINNPPDGVGTGEMDYRYTQEYTDIYSDDSTPATPVIEVEIM